MIVDASALLLLLVPGRGFPMDETRLEALFGRISRREPLESPALTAYELGHVIHRKRAGEIGTSTAERVAAARRLLALVELRGVDPLLMARAGEAAETARISFYDATYLGHAVQAGPRLLTADAGMKSHAAALGVTAYLLPDDVGALEAAYPEDAAG